MPALAAGSGSGLPRAGLPARPSSLSSCLLSLHLSMRQRYLFRLSVAEKRPATFSGLLQIVSHKWQA